MILSIAKYFDLFFFVHADPMKLLYIETSIHFCFITNEYFCWYSIT